MKRKLALMIALVLALTAVFVLAACTNDDNKNNVNPTLTEPEAKYGTDNRTNAYVAYKADGTKLGEYKTIADAIGAAVETDSGLSKGDVNTTTYGSYVTTTDGVKIFQNRNGYASASDDQFWFYDNGTSLYGYDCYDKTLYSTALKNSTLITYEVTARGTSAVQYHNGYYMYEADGTLNDDVSAAAQSWELSSTMDAAVIQIPARLSGVSGLDYELDMSNVKITPHYEGTDDVYAFVGFYAWQDYYVICIGLACDTTTGAWYPFQATSRDDSFSDAEYKLSENPIMISDWNEGGYWTPQQPTITMKARTVRKEDDAGIYFVAELNFKVLDKDGNVYSTYDRTLDDESVNQFFTGYGIGAEEAFVFVAGLDIRNTVTNGVHVGPTDYTNGAKFENLTVTKATAHIAGEDELTASQYSPGNFKYTRGEDYNLLMASGTHEEGVLDYTLLNTAACATYKAVDGKDVYSFDYSGSNVADNIKTGELKTYQDQVDELKAVTAENVASYKTKIDAVAALYADSNVALSTVNKMYYECIDFTPYITALEIFNQNAKLSEAGEAFVTAFSALPSLSTYEYVGWYTEDTANATGYLKNDLLKFNELVDDYNNLSQDDKDLLEYKLNKTDLDMYLDFCDKLFGDYYGSWSIETRKEGTVTEVVTYTAEEAISEMIKWTYLIKKPSVWADENDDPNENAKATVFNSDNNWLPAYHVLFLKARVEESGKDVPDFVQYLIEITGESDGFFDDFAYIDAVLTIASMIENDGVYEVTEEIAELVNNYMIGQTYLDEDGVAQDFTEGGLKWNWNNSEGADFTYRSKVYKAYYDLDIDTTLSVYIQKVQNFVTKRVDAEVDGVGFKNEITAKKIEVSEAAQTVISMFDETKILGGSFTAYEEAIAAYEKLGDVDKSIVEALSDYETLVALVGGNKADIEATDFKNAPDMTVFETIAYNTATATKTITAKEALTQLYELAYRIQAGDTWASNENDEGNSRGTKTMNFDTATYPSYRIIAIKQYLEENEITLSETILEVLDNIGYDDFFYAYDSIYQTIYLAATYATDSTKTLADMTEADKAAFEKYWGKTSKISDLFAWNWNSGNKFEMYMSARVAAILQVVDADMDGEFNNTIFGDEYETVSWIYGDVLEVYTYKDVEYWTYKYEDEAVSNGRTYGAFSLKSNGYWTWANIYVDADGNICDSSATGATLLTKDAAGMTYKEDATENCAQGPFTVYVTTDGTNVYTKQAWSSEKGTYYIEGEYVDINNRTLSSEINLAGVKPVVTGGEVKVYRFAEVFAAWLEAQGCVLNSNGWGLKPDFVAKAEGVTTATQNYSYESALQEAMDLCDKIAAGDAWVEIENDDPNKNGVTTMTSDYNWLVSYHILYLREMLVAAGQDVTALDAKIEAIKGDGKLQQDFYYLHTLMTIAQNGSDVTLTDAQKTAIASYVEGKESFADDGLTWNWNASEGVKFTYRYQHWLAYYGFDVDSTSVKEILTSALNIIVAQMPEYEINESGLGLQKKA